MSTASAAVLRHRADQLRTLARRLEHLEVHALVQRCGTDTWVGPSQQHWSDELRRAERALAQAAQVTRAAARRLEHQAEQLAHADPAARGWVR